MNLLNVTMQALNRMDADETDVTYVGSASGFHVMPWSEYSARANVEFDPNICFVASDLRIFVDTMEGQQVLYWSTLENTFWLDKYGSTRIVPNAAQYRIQNLFGDCPGCQLNELN